MKRVESSQCIQPHWETTKTHPRRNPDVDQSHLVLSLGSLLRELREARNLNQADVSELLGGKRSSSQISEIEHGNGELDRVFIDKIVRLFNLDPAQRSQLLLAGRFLPSEQDIANLASTVQERMEEIPFPQSITDFGGRLLIWNSHYATQFGLDESKAEIITSKRPNILEMLFDHHKWMTRERFSIDWDEFSRLEVISFYMDQIRFGTPGTRWYELLMVRLISLPDFQQTWPEVYGIGFRKLIKDHPLINAGERKLTLSQSPQVTIARYRIYRTQMAYDTRMFTTTYVPY